MPRNISKWSLDNSGLGDCHVSFYNPFRRRFLSQAFFLKQGQIALLAKKTFSLDYWDFSLCAGGASIIWTLLIRKALLDIVF